MRSFVQFEKELAAEFRDKLAKRRLPLKLAIFSAKQRKSF